MVSFGITIAGPDISVDTLLPSPLQVTIRASITYAPLR